MILRVVKAVNLLSLLLLIESNCNDNYNDIDQQLHEKSKYLEQNNKNFNEKWQKFYDLIEEAKHEVNSNEDKQQIGQPCQRFLDFMANDLSLWNKTGITRELIQETINQKRGVHYQIIDKSLYRESECMFPSRCEGVEHFINKGINDLPDLDLVINVRDYPQVHKNWHNLPILSFSKDITQYNDILYPAWTFWCGGPAIDRYPTGIGRWDQMRTSIYKNSVDWKDKSSVAFFRGSRTSAERDPLIRLSRAKPHLVDAQYTANQAWRSVADTLGEQPAPTVSFEEQCNYKYLFNLRGVAASFRYKHLFLCKSVVLNVESDWIEFFYPQLKPWFHFVPIAKDFSDAQQKIEFLKDNDRIAENIAKNGFEFIWNQLTPDSVQCYWNELLQRYSKLVKYVPKANNNLIKIKKK